ncbi:hypothetical protein F0562_028601 [Nyssa sinensis]|uniref:ATP-dependent Clp protease proteolytic subunit n=1 Tax=Nyssa sinensis TaxID=561372 RepID=A0A5J5AYN0_9ASTE|nr:hypothetical protein F0562_028601 [Nyssa sinensis]
MEASSLAKSSNSCNLASCLSQRALFVDYQVEKKARSIVSALPSPYSDSSKIGLSSKRRGLPLKLDDQDFGATTKQSYGAVEAKRGNPPMMRAVMTPGGPLDLSTVLFRNRIIFIGQPINSQVAQRVISQLVTLATIHEDADILVWFI